MVLDQRGRPQCFGFLFSNHWSLNVKWNQLSYYVRYVHSYSETLLFLLCTCWMKGTVVVIVCIIVFCLYMQMFLFLTFGLEVAKRG